MKRLMVKYKVKSEYVDKNEAYIRDVFEELKSTAPVDIRYVSFKLEDGQSFVHIVSIESEDGSNPLPELAAFKTFVSEIKERCEEPPQAIDLLEIGSYNFFS